MEVEHKFGDKQASGGGLFKRASGTQSSPGRFRFLVISLPYGLPIWRENADTHLRQEKCDFWVPTVVYLEITISQPIARPTYMKSHFEADGRLPLPMVINLGFVPFCGRDSG